MKRNETFMLLGLTAVLAVGGLGISKTFSYFTHKDTVTNVFTMGDLDLDLREPEWNPEDGDGEDVYPGYTVYKNPTVKNIAEEGSETQPCYLKMIVDVLDKDGNRITDTKRLEMIRKTIHYDASYTGSWAETGEATGLIQGNVPGYSEKDLAKYPMVNPVFDELEGSAGSWEFGYKGGTDQTLKEEEEVTLFTNVVFPAEWTNEDMELVGEFQLQITAHGIQAKGFSNRTEAFAALKSSK